jgi:hypothetical protein
MENQEDDYKYAMRCDITGQGFNEGFVIGGGDMYIEDEAQLIAHLRDLDWEDADGNLIHDLGLSDDDLKEYFYNEEYYYYTEFDQKDICDDDDYYLEDGTLIEYKPTKQI